MKNLFVRCPECGEKIDYIYGEWEYECDNCGFEFDGCPEEED